VTQSPSLNKSMPSDVVVITVLRSRIWSGSVNMGCSTPVIYNDNTPAPIPSICITISVLLIPCPRRSSCETGTADWQDEADVICLRGDVMG
jgi:hypothetical protein